MSESQTPPVADIPRAWPFEEARRLADHVATREGGDDVRPALLETGYGPSGLPHIGTFCEVARTSWVRQASPAPTGRPYRGRASGVWGRAAQKPVHIGASAFIETSCPGFGDLMNALGADIRA